MSDRTCVFRRALENSLLGVICKATGYAGGYLLYAVRNDRFFILFHGDKIQYQIVMFDKPIDPDRLVSVKIGGCTVTFQ